MLKYRAAVSIRLNTNKKSTKNFVRSCRILFLHSRFSSYIDCGSSSFGRARPCQGRGREFESRFPLQINSIGSCGCFSIKGALAKRLCSGLQIRLVRFDSGTRLHFISRARMVESVDTRDLKSLGVRAVWVQVPLRVPWETSE